MSGTDIGVIIIACAFVVLVAFLAYTLVILARSLKKIDSVLTPLRQDVTLLRQESITLMESTHMVLIDVQNKLQALNPIFHSIESLGETINSSLCKSTKSHSQPHPSEIQYSEKSDAVESLSTGCIEAIKWALAGRAVIKRFFKK